MAYGHGGRRPGSGRKPNIILAERQTLSEKAREHTDDALQTLVEVCKDKKAPPAARVQAANALIDRGYGKPPQAVEIGGIGGDDLTVTNLNMDVSAEDAARLYQDIIKS